MATYIYHYHNGNQGGGGKVGQSGSDVGGGRGYKITRNRKYT